MRAIWSVLACVALGWSMSGAAQHFRWASQGDAASLDPHAQNENVTNQVNALVYESLLQYDKEMRLVPWLATSWENPSPKAWIFHLRRDVKFHDGTPLTADDVVFSFERAKQTSASFKPYANEAGTARRIDDHTVEFTTAVEVLVIPLHRQVLPWVSRPGVTVVHRPNNALFLPWVRM